MYRVTFGNKQAICPPIKDRAPPPDSISPPRRVGYTPRKAGIFHHKPQEGVAEKQGCAQICIYIIFHTSFRARYKNLTPTRKTGGRSKIIRSKKYQKLSDRFYPKISAGMLRA